MNIPSNLKYTKDHEWVKIDGDIATIGITDFAQSELGDIVYVEVETLDETLRQKLFLALLKLLKPCLIYFFLFLEKLLNLMKLC